MARLDTRWTERLAAAVPPGINYYFATAVLDPDSEEVVGHSSRFLDSMMPTGPRTLGDLIDRGCVDQGDIDDLLEQGAADPTTCSTVTSTGLVRTKTDDELADRHVTWLPSFDGAEPALVVTVQLHSQMIDAAAGPPPSRRAAINYVYDTDATIVAADWYLDSYALDPSAHVGVSSLLLCHPEDLALTYPQMAAVARGSERSVDYIVRGAGPFGMWSPVHIELRSLAAPEPLMLATVEPIAPNRRTLPPDVLTDRELDIVFSLFRGLRVSQVCDRFGVSEKTVRNHLSVIFRKLDVATQAELLETYARPTRTVAQLTIAED